MEDEFDKARTDHVLAESLLENKGYQKLFLPKVNSEIEVLTRRILDDTQMEPSEREKMIVKRLAWVEVKDFLDAVQRESDRVLRKA
jgi:hypothetical protein